MKLEERRYGPESSPTEVEAIRSCVSMYADRVLLWHQVPLPTEFSVDVMAQRVAELEADLDAYALLIDLTRAGRPSAGVRVRLRAAFRRDKLVHAAAFTERNVLLNAAAYFVLNGLGLRSHSVSRTREQALAAIADAF